MFKFPFSSRLRINMISTVATQGLNVVVMAAGYPIYLHYLGYSTYGIWLALGAVIAFAQLGDLGIRTSVIKLVAEEHGKGDHQGIQQYVTMSLALLTVSGTVALLIILVFQTEIIALFRFPKTQVHHAVWLLPWLGVLSVYVLVLQSLKAVLSGLGRMDHASYIDTGGRVASIAISAFLLWSGMKLESLLIGSFISQTGQHIASIILIRRLTPIRFFRLSNWNRDRLRNLYGFGSRIFGGSMLSMMLDPFNRMMLSRYVGPAAIPIYEMTYQSANQFRSLFSEAMRPVMPEISRLSGEGTTTARERIVSLNRKFGKLVTLGGLPVSGCLYLLAPFIFQIWLGDQYSEEIPPVFRLMLVGAVVSFVSVPAYYTLMGMNRVDDCFIGHLLRSVVSMAALLAVYFYSPALLSPMTVAGTIVLGFAATTVYLFYRQYRLLRTLTGK